MFVRSRRLRLGRAPYLEGHALIDVPACELCPHCGCGISLRRTDGNMIEHPRGGPRCPGADHRSPIPHLATTPTAHYQVSGRLNAEIIARTRCRASSSPSSAPGSASDAPP